jgi:sporulation protein YlmC with PRC-barrel domain
MFKPMHTPLLSAALLAVVGIASAQAQDVPARKTTNVDNAPSIAMETTGMAGADARKLIGRNIKNAQNDTIGEIKSIHLDSSGKVDAVIASVGGFLGMGDREVLLNWRDLRIENNGELVRVNMTKDELKAQAPYNYKDQSLRGTVFTDSGVWRDTAHPSRVDRTDRAHDRAHDMAAATPNVANTKSTGDFNVAGQMSAEALIGKNVKNASDESVGKITDMYVDANGAVKLLVVSVGGFLGVGSKDVGVPWTDLKFGRDGNDLTVTTNWTRDSLKAMPDYKAERRMPADHPTRSGG